MSTDYAVIGTNAGHGHAWDRPDGAKAKCGGPIFCAACAVDHNLVQQQKREEAS